MLWEDLPTSPVPPLSVPVPEARLQMEVGMGLTEGTISPLSQTQQRPQATCPVIGSTALVTENQVGIRNKDERQMEFSPVHVGNLR